MTDPIYARDGRIHIRICDGWGEDHEDCTVEEAREYAQQLQAAITLAEQHLETIRAACADGHDWGSFMNGWRGYPSDRIPVTTHWCNRTGCDAHEILDGWVQYAGRLHIDPLRGDQLTCYGPGCEHCADEKIGQAMHQMFATAREALTSHLGIALGGPKGN